MANVIIKGDIIYTKKDSNYYLGKRNGHPYRYCKLDRNNNSTGIGFVYKDGDERKYKVVEFENGEEVKTLYRIDEYRRVMIEYDEDGEKIYEGNYKKIKQVIFLRHGMGKEYKNGTLVYGEWEDDEEVGSNIALHSTRSNSSTQSTTYSNSTITNSTHQTTTSSSRTSSTSQSSKDDSEKVKGKMKATGAAIGATAATGMATNAVGGAATLLGFSNPGIVAGTWAARLMSTFGTPGWISALQSAGALFGGGVVAATAAVTVPLAVGAAAYYFTTKQQEEENKDKKK